MNTSDLNPIDCQHFEELVHTVLDGSTPEHAIRSHAHPLQCVRCATRLQAFLELQSYSARATAQQYNPPPLLEARILDALKSESQKSRPRRSRTFAASIVLAASLLLASGFGIWYSMQSSQPTIVEVPPMPVEPAREIPQPTVAAQLADASEALSTITRKTTEKATAPSRTIWQTAERAATPKPKPLEQAVPKLPDVQQVARASFEPMANSTRRALNLFVRDFGIAEPR